MYGSSAVCVISASFYKEAHLMFPVVYQDKQTFSPSALHVAEDSGNEN